MPREDSRYETHPVAEAGEFVGLLTLLSLIALLDMLRRFSEKGDTNSADAISREIVSRMRRTEGG